MDGLRNARTAVDFGRPAQDYARFRRGLPATLCERVEVSFGVGLCGQEPLDVGTGTGALLCERRPEAPLRVTQRAFAEVGRAPA
jgi:hypothetical protein